MQYGADAQNILQIAAEKARGLGHSYVGSAHLLLALAQSFNSLSVVKHIQLLLMKVVLL